MNSLQEILPRSQVDRRQMMVGSGIGLASIAVFSSGIAQEPSKPPRKIVVTIDDGPATGSGRDLEAYLRIANGIRENFVAEKVPAIMFVNEQQLNVNGQRDARVDILHKWLDAGLDLGNHTYSHPRPDAAKLWQYFDDIVKGEVITRPILEARSKKLVWYRYPYLATSNGETAKAIEDFLAQRGYKIAPVSVDYSDYNYTSAYMRFLRAGQKEQADEHFSGVMKALDNSFAQSEAQSTRLLGYELPQTLLIHCNEMNSLTLRITIERIRSRGYSFVSMDEAMQDPAYNVTGLRPGALGGGGVINALGAAKTQR